MLLEGEQGAAVDVLRWRVKLPARVAIAWVAAALASVSAAELAVRRDIVLGESVPGYPRAGRPGRP